MRALTRHLTAQTELVKVCAKRAAAYPRRGDVFVETMLQLSRASIRPATAFAALDRTAFILPAAIHLPKLPALPEVGDTPSLYILENNLGRILEAKQRIGVLSLQRGSTDEGREGSARRLPLPPPAFAERKPNSPRRRCRTPRLSLFRIIRSRGMVRRAWRGRG